MKSIREYFDQVEQINKLVEEVATTNPYTDPKQAAIYDKLTPQDQAWATQGGGQPDLTDPFILNRMPNKGKQVEPAPAAPAQPTAQAAQPAKASWPATRDEIIAFQASHKDAEGNPLKQDGLIGQRTMAALQAAGATPPAGFKPVANKATAPAATTTPPTGQGARPVKSAANAPAQSTYAAMLAAKEKLDAAKSQDSWYLPTSAATQSTIDQAEKDYAAAQQAHFKAASAAQAASNPQLAAKQNQIKALQAQLAKTTDPTQRQSIQTAINTIQQTSESVTYGEDQTLARIVDLARK